MYVKRKKKEVLLIKLIKKINKNDLRRSEIKVKTEVNTLDNYTVHVPAQDMMPMLNSGIDVECVCRFYKMC